MPLRRQGAGAELRPRSPPSRDDDRNRERRVDWYPASVIPRPIYDAISPAGRRCVVIAKQPAVKSYIATLGADERERLNTLIQKSTSPARQQLVEEGG
jgi:hypothetical protein